MARIVIVGGHGKIALRLSEQLSARGAHVLGTVRDPGHVEDLTQVGSEAVAFDLEQDSVDKLTDIVDGADAVVFAAGAGPDGRVERKQTVDYQGSVMAVAAAERAGVPRFVQVSAIGVDAPLSADTPDVWTAYVTAKRDADAQLRQSSLDWTILRPGRLTDDAPTGHVALAESLERGDVPRADVAAVVAAVLDDPRSIGHQWELVGGDRPVEEAITAAL